MHNGIRRGARSGSAARKFLVLGLAALLAARSGGSSGAAGVSAIVQVPVVPASELTPAGG